LTRVEAETAVFVVDLVEKVIKEGGFVFDLELPFSNYVCKVGGVCDGELFVYIEIFLIFANHELDGFANNERPL
jgi:hypothetical protein